MYFVGIDLAWSDKNSSGIAILKGDNKQAKLVSSGIVHSDDDIINYIKSNINENDAHIGIDAPLIVPNEEGRRIAEAIVSDLFRKYHAGAHPSNRKRLSQWSGKIRGEEISRLLEKEGYNHDPFISKGEISRKFYEVFPHPSMVVLFNMDLILKYKLKPKRDYEYRWNEFKKYQEYLKNISTLSLPDEIVNKDVTKLKGKALKNYEDLLDAVFCAYICYYSWLNPEKCKVLGSMEEGYIYTPVFSHMM